MSQNPQRETRTAYFGDGHLSPRERQVVELVAAGLTCRQIADRLGTTVRTVKSQRQNALFHLGGDGVRLRKLLAQQAGVRP